MIVELNFKNSHCIVTKEDGDLKFRHSGWASAESTFLYHVKKEILAQGHDVIKKRMWKDGHLMDDETQYIRARDKSWCVWNSSHQIFDAGIEFNEQGKIVLALVMLSKVADCGR